MLCDNTDSLRVQEEGNIWVVDNTRVLLAPGPTVDSGFIRAKASSLLSQFGEVRSLANMFILSAKVLSKDDLVPEIICGLSFRKGSITNRHFNI